MVPDNIKQEFFQGESYFSIDPSNKEEMQFIKDQFKIVNNTLDELIDGQIDSIEKVSKFPNIVYSKEGIFFTNTKTGRKYLGKISSYMNLLPLHTLIKRILNDIQNKPS